MIFHRLGLINKNQRGVSLLELIIALAITAIITGAITMTIFQVFDVNARSSNHMVAVRQVQNAGYWISRDAHTAQIVELTEPEGNPVGTKFPLTLTWFDWDNTKHEVVYRLENMIGGSKQLERHHLTYDTDGDVIGDETSIVARYINPGRHNTNCKFSDGDSFILTVTAKLGEASETRVYEVLPRPSLQW